MIRPLLLAASLLAACPAAAAPGPTLAERLGHLVAAYPGAGLAVADGLLRTPDGRVYVIDDRRAKDHQGALNDADVEDALAQVYPVGACQRAGQPARNADPGRVRHEGLMRALFGATRAEVEAGLVPVEWFGRTIRFQGRAGAAEALGRVAADLAGAPPEEMRVLQAFGGTYNWRVIAGTDRLSAHAYGIAIDLDVQNGAYWRWGGGTPGNVAPTEVGLPAAIVAAFERHGFVWGGRWYHHDTMHFEYRPEILAIGRAAEAMGCPPDAFEGRN